MIRSIILAAILLLAAQQVTAQQPTTVQLTLDPMAEPVPALRYYLLPQVRDRQNGNAALMYFRAFSPEWQTHRRDSKFMTRLADSNDRPLRMVNQGEIDSLIKGFSPLILKEIDRGARRSYCDWELNQRVKEDGIGLLLPDLQGLRELVSLLKLRARKELLEGHFDEAARTLQTGMQLGRHAADGPTLIHGLVGVTCASIMLTVVDDWVERPGAPNLYWALTDLPHPLISMRNGLEGERQFMDWLFPGYRDLLENPNATPSSARVQTSLEKYAGMLDPEGVVKRLGPLLIAMKTYPHAKRFLRQTGRKPEEIEAMPALQTVFLYEIHKYDVAYDDLRKWANLPYTEALPHVQRMNERLKTAMSKREAGSTLATLLLPAIERVLAAPVRVERKIAALRCVETIRLHAASHGGKLPSRLDEITEVPIPLDPRTGKSFEYRLEGNKATLTAPAPKDEKPTLYNSIRYELTMRTSRGEKETKRQEQGEKEPFCLSFRALGSPPFARNDKQARVSVAASLTCGSHVSTSAPGREDAKFDPEERARTLAPLIDDETFALVRVDFTRADLDGLSKTLSMLFPSRESVPVALDGRIKTFREAFTKAGGSELVISFSTEDLPAISFVYIPLKDGANAEEITRLVKSNLPTGFVVHKRGSTLVAGSSDALSRFARAKPSKRPELAAAVTAAGDTAVQVFLLPTPDQRRVIEEMVTLPMPGASGKTLTKGIRWAALGLEFGAKPQARLTIQSLDAPAARKLAELFTAGFALVGEWKFLGEDKRFKELHPKEFQTIARGLVPQVDGSLIRLQLSAADDVKALAVLVDSIPEHAETSTSGQNMQQILVALHRYTDAIGYFPSHAIYSKAGKPLLSWRVALLPYLGQQSLYSQFKLDEPWDSAHNKKLIERIPTVYRSPKIKDARPGLTTYLAPINKEFVFTGAKKGLRFPREVTDGTAHTAVVVDVNDGTGVPWTKPDDLMVDRKDPWKGLMGHYPSFVLFGMADASVVRIPKTAKADTLWALFTRAGGEIIPDLSE